MALKLKKKESPNFGFVRLGNSISVQAGKLAHKGNQATTEEIHDMRLLIKRLRSLFRLIREVTDTQICKEENKNLRAASKELAPFREFDVRKETIEWIFTQTKNKFLCSTLKPFKKNRKKKLQKPNGSLSQSLRNCSLQLNQSVQVLEELPWQAVGWYVLEPGLSRSYRRARKAYLKVLQDSKAEDFHQWRMKVKDLMYQMEFISEMSPKHLNSMRKKLKKLSSILGRDHDLCDFKKFLQSQTLGIKRRISYGSTKEELSKEIDLLRWKARKKGRKIFKERTGTWLSEIKKFWFQWKKKAA